MAHLTLVRSAPERPTLSQQAKARAEALRRLATDLERHSDDDRHGDRRIVAVLEALLHGDDAALDESEVAYLRRLGVLVPSGT